MEFLVALIELRVLVVVVGTIDLPGGGGGHLTFFIRGCAYQKKNFQPAPEFSAENDTLS